MKKFIAILLVLCLLVCNVALLSSCENGEDGQTPFIGENGNWWIGDTDTGVKANGENGATPHIGENGNWWIGDTDTGIAAQGKDGNDNNEIVLICIGIATLCLITTIVAVATRRRRYRWWILT